jgi:hypothetical protein
MKQRLITVLVRTAYLVIWINSAEERSWKASSRSAAQRNICLLCRPEFRYRVLKVLPLTRTTQLLTPPSIVRLYNLAVAHLFKIFSPVCGTSICVTVDCLDLFRAVKTKRSIDRDWRSCRMVRGMYEPGLSHCYVCFDMSSEGSADKCIKPSTHPRGLRCCPSR